MTPTKIKWSEIFRLNPESVKGLNSQQRKDAEFKVLVFSVAIGILSVAFLAACIYFSIFVFEEIKLSFDKPKLIPIDLGNGQTLTLTQDEYNQLMRDFDLAIETDDPVLQFRKALDILETLEK